MKVKALKSFSGKITMQQGEERIIDKKTFLSLFTANLVEPLEVIIEADLDPEDETGESVDETDESVGEASENAEPENTEPEGKTTAKKTTKKK